MTGFRFYIEYDTPAKKRKGEHNGNVVAVITENVRHNGDFDAIGAVYYVPDSPVASTGVSREYLRTKTKRVSEAVARQIHGELFSRLDDKP